MTVFVQPRAIFGKTLAGGSASQRDFQTRLYWLDRKNTIDDEGCSPEKRQLLPNFRAAILSVKGGELCVTSEPSRALT